MEESNCRRIKRTIMINIKTIQFCDTELLQQLKRVNHLTSYITEKESEIESHNSLISNSDDTVNSRQLTNIGLFREYLYEYLKNHPSIQSSATILVRQLQSSEYGVPIEIYCFTTTTDWIKYEDIQSDIFDHLFSIISNFKLEVFQVPIAKL